MQQRDRWLSAGLFLTTLASLLLELLDSRLLSVLTWYHLSFLAVSLAMLGASAGAVLVFVAGSRVSGAAAARALARTTLLLALSIPIAHVVLLRMRIPPLEEFDVREILPLAGATLVLAVPFVLSGAAITIALTRMRGRIGLLYGSDLVGASVGCLLIVPLLNAADIFSAALVAGAIAAAGAACFQRLTAAGRGRLPATTALALTAAAGVHLGSGSPIDVAYPRGTELDRNATELSLWNAYSHVRVERPRPGPPFFWGRGKSPQDLRVDSSLMLIDGAAGTALTKWDGEPESIAWVQYDVTSLPYHLRSGDVAIIGVGGGRDVLSALWAGSRSVVAIELNEIFVDLLNGSHRDFAGIALRPEVRLVNDEARSFLTRSDDRFDVLQMSLVDTWAATGAGAFTLSENALYTVEAWKVFLGRLEPDGIFSTSRWFSPENVSETSRLLSLCIATLLELGFENPAEHVALVSRGKIATLLVAAAPFTEQERMRLEEIARRYAFRVLVLPGRPVENPRLAAIMGSRSLDALAVATDDPDYDYGAPTDSRPYFFNMLKPHRFYRLRELPSGAIFGGSGGVIWGNIRATVTLFVLLVIAVALVALIIFLPLAWSGLPAMRGRTFLYAMSYFALIGYGFMSIQIPFLQRFSIFLGHPIFTFSVILFSMIFFAGIGSLLSDRILLERSVAPLAVPMAIAVLLVAIAIGLQPVLDATIAWELPARALVVVAITAPVSLLLGFCFPFGLRLVSAVAPGAAPWMWGMNGASGVIASIVAVIVSLWTGTDTNLMVAALLYLLLALPARAMLREATTGTGAVAKSV